MNNNVLVEDTNAFAERFELGESLRGKTFLITGATGLIGSVMIKCLLALNKKGSLGMKIIAVVRDIEKAQDVFADEFYMIEFRELSLEDISVPTVGLKVDYIVHLASPTASKYFVEHPVETLRTALEGTTAILDYAKEAEVKGMVYASSLEVYGSNNNDNLIDENFQGYINPLDVRSSYSIGKRACECLCHTYAKEFGINVMMARLTQTFGAGISENDNRVFAQFARSIMNGDNIVLHTEGKSAKPYCYTTDAVSALLYMLLRGEGGEAYNIANENSYISIREMAHMMCEEFNPSITVSVVIKEDQGYAPVTRLRLDTQKIKSLGWHPNYDLRNMFGRLLLFLK